MPPAVFVPMSTRTVLLGATSPAPASDGAVNVIVCPETDAPQTPAPGAAASVVGYSYPVVVPWKKSMSLIVTAERSNPWNVSWTLSVGASTPVGVTNVMRWFVDALTSGSSRLSLMKTSAAERDDGIAITNPTMAIRANVMMERMGLGFGVWGLVNPNPKSQTPSRSTRPNLFRISKRNRDQEKRFMEID